ncbi:MAG: NAD(P)/FAD-dependent oxidoreductase [Brevinema sp.]
MIRYEKRTLVIVGGGAAGMAAAIKAYHLGIKDILLLERDRELGGILYQCIHDGFGLHRFKEELTGPEYVEKWLHLLSECSVTTRVDASVLSITPDKELTVQSPEGIFKIQAEAIIFSVGCMERPRGAISLPGPRVSGIMTAGSAQRFLNMDGRLPGKKVVILGSGDIGLIMARRMTLEGAKVLGVYELLPFSSGLERNIVQCLRDYDIPLFFSKTVYQVHGKARLEGVTIIDVDQNRQPVLGTEQYIECDTLLLSVGLVPAVGILEKAGVAINPSSRGPIVNQMMETSIPGIFACGNSLHVHDLVDNVSEEGEKAALGASLFLNGGQQIVSERQIIAGNGLIYTVPRSIKEDTDENFYQILFRVSRPIEGKITISCQNNILHQYPSKHLSPGEMEKVVIPKMKLPQHLEEITVHIEE